MKRETPMNGNRLKSGIFIGVFGKEDLLNLKESVHGELCKHPFQRVARMG